MRVYMKCIFLDLLQKNIQYRSVVSDLTESEDVEGVLRWMSVMGVP